MVSSDAKVLSRGPVNQSMMLRVLLYCYPDVLLVLRFYWNALLWLGFSFPSKCFYCDSCETIDRCYVTFPLVNPCGQIWLGYGDASPPNKLAPPSASTLVVTFFGHFRWPVNPDSSSFNLLATLVGR
ncbi:hypothetical protein ACH5RR_037148 [Cinchona calisaya]|uniref:Uncharacterized protein n=1 Tax=Cinchona calisaya TaxID=153742 RepID=A0ABD2Y9P0_9GENT